MSPMPLAPSSSLASLPCQPPSTLYIWVTSKTLHLWVISNGSLDLSEESETLVGELVTLAPPSPPLSEVSETHAALALLDFSEESETLVGEPVTLASSMAKAGSAASGSIGSLSLSEGFPTLADRVTLALLALSGV